ncbi:UNVERIFIED_CONTAM: hypothetical protein GTU68_060492 [Idotea baltica]|nr:hypothetical protein [Idotea baltica]
MIQIENISKSYPSRKTTVEALKDINLKIDKSEFVLIKGESGSGKSTLLYLIGGLLKPSSGNIRVNDISILDLSASASAKYRVHSVGFVFQSYHLLPYLNVIDNIMLANKIDGIIISKKDVMIILDDIGIEERAFHYPSQLSAGEKQRVALARAMITNPSIILADEPTGNLDEKNANFVLSYLKRYQEAGGTVVLVTHGRLPESYATRIIKLDKGKVIN